MGVISQTSCLPVQPASYWRVRRSSQSQSRQVQQGSMLGTAHLGISNLLDHTSRAMTSGLWNSTVDFGLLLLTLALLLRCWTSQVCVPALSLQMICGGSQRAGAVPWVLIWQLWGCKGRVRVCKTNVLEVGTSRYACPSMIDGLCLVPDDVWWSFPVFRLQDAKPGP